MKKLKKNDKIIKHLAIIFDWPISEVYNAYLKMPTTKEPTERELKKYLIKIDNEKQEKLKINTVTNVLSGELGETATISAFVNNSPLQKKIIINEISQNLINKYVVTNGINILYGGRNWDFDKLVRKKYKDSLINGMIDSKMNALQTYGHNLVITSYNSMCSHMCIDYQNKIFWVNSKVGNYSEFKKILFKYGGTFLHPHCRHFFNPYFPDYSDPPLKNVLSNEEISKNYENDQKIKYNIRNKQKYYKRMRTAQLNGDSKSYEHNKKKWRKWLNAEKGMK